MANRLNTKNITQNICKSALCAAFCVILPVLTHSIPQAGKIYSPIHIPVLLCGLICPWQYALMCGVIGPLLSHIITGMPAAPSLLRMMLECAAYGLCCAVSFKFIRTKFIIADVYISLVLSMVFGRIVAGIAKSVMLSSGMSLEIWITTYFVESFPAVILHLITVPIVYKILSKAKVVEKRY